VAGPLLHARGGGPSKFCINWNCGFAHSNKAWATLLPGGSYVQVLDKHALFVPMLPLEAADQDLGSVAVLGELFTKEVWASVFMQLMDQGKDGTVGTRELVYLAVAPGAKATPRLSASKCGRDDDSTGKFGDDQGEDITKILRCLRQIKGELGICSKAVAYRTVHGGLANFHSRWAQVNSDMGNLPKQSDFDLVVLCASTAKTQSNTAIHELNKLRLHRNTSGKVSGLKTLLENAQEEMKKMSGQMDILGKIVQGMVDTQALHREAALPPSGSFATQADLDRHVEQVNLTLGGFCQELEEGALVLGGFKFVNQDACRVWCLTHMPVNAYQSSEVALCPLLPRYCVKLS
jgi:hypothetical protein